MYRVGLYAGVGGSNQAAAWDVLIELWRPTSLSRARIVSSWLLGASFIGGTGLLAGLGPSEGPDRRLFMPIWTWIAWEGARTSSSEAKGSLEGARESSTGTEETWEAGVQLPASPSSIEGARESSRLS